MIRLSFIVPFYNVEKYIKDCLRSLYNQDISMEEYEVICVDDCSPDGSRAIVERLQKEYPTLRLLVHTENKRQGGARNTGLREAKGKYVWFVDSDDYIKPNCLKGLLEQVESEDLDILDFDFDSDFTKQQYRKNVEEYDMGPCAGADYVFNTRKGRWSWRCSSVCGAIIRRELIHDLPFRENVQYEDNDYALWMYAKAKRVHHISDRPYYYRVVEDSTVHAVVTLKHVNYNIQLIRAYMRMYDKMKVIDERWAHGLEELIRYVSSQVLRQLHQVSEEEQGMFYKQHMGRIQNLKLHIGLKPWIALQSKIARRVLGV